jgi:hypothetical protein
MSVDERLREAFGATDPAWQGRVPDALAEVSARHRRETVVRRVAAAGAVAAVVAVGAVAAVHESTDRSAPVPPATRTPSPGPAATDFPLDGTWTSGELVRADVRRAAAAAGDVNDVDAMLAELPSPPFRVVLVVNEAGNSLALHVRSGDVDQVLDEENVEVTESRLLLHPRFGEGGNIHSWTIEDGLLRLTFLSTTEGESDGVPAEAWQRLLYDSTAFTQ